MSALVLAFKRPEPAPKKPTTTRDEGRETIAFYRDQFDKNLRYLFDAETSTAERQYFLNWWRKNCGFEVLECTEVAQ